MKHLLAAACITTLSACSINPIREADVTKETFECINGTEYHVIRMTYETEEIGVMIIKPLRSPDGNHIQCGEA